LPQLLFQQIEIDRLGDELGDSAAKTVAEQLGHIGLVADNENPDAQSRSSRCCGLLLARQAYREFRERAGLAVDLDRTAVLLRDDIVADR
jgi:hypothetical protein